MVKVVAKRLVKCRRALKRRLILLVFVAIKHGIDFIKFFFAFFELRFRRVHDVKGAGSKVAVHDANVRAGYAVLLADVTKIKWFSFLAFANNQQTLVTWKRT